MVGSSPSLKMLMIVVLYSDLPPPPLPLDFFGPRIVKANDGAAKEEVRVQMPN